MKGENFKKNYFVRIWDRGLSFNEQGGVSGDWKGCLEDCVLGLWRAGESWCSENEEKGTKGPEREEINISRLSEFLKTVYRKVAKIVVAIEM